MSGRWEKPKSGRAIRSKIGHLEKLKTPRMDSGNRMFTVSVISLGIKLCIFELYIQIYIVSSAAGQFLQIAQSNMISLFNQQITQINAAWQLD